MPDDGGSPELSPPDPEVAPPPPPPPPALASRPSRRRLISRRGATAAVATGLVVGGVAGGYVISQAATTPSATTSPSAGTTTPPHHPGGFGGGGSAARVQDLQQTAGVIGITTAQLQTEMSAGKTVSAIAKEHSIDPAKVIATLVSDENSEIDAAVSSGQLTQAQAMQIKTQTTRRVTDFVNGTAPPHGPGGPGRPGGPRGGLQAEDQQVVATAVGITTTQLQSELTAGKTIAAIATEHGSTAAKVVSALAASENSEIDQRVSSGQLSAAQGAQMKTTTVQRVTDLVNGTEPAHGGFGGHGGPPGAPAGSPPTT
jgi:thymidine kinase